MPFHRLALSLILLKVLGAAADITLGTPVPVTDNFVDYIRGVPSGAIVLCTITNGADEFFEYVEVDLRMSSDSGFTIASTCDDGYRSCSVGPIDAVSEVEVVVYAEYADATLTCIAPTPTVIEPGVPINIPNLEIDSSFVGIISPVPVNSQVTCALDGDNGQNENGDREDADLYLDLYSSEGEVSECSSLGFNEDESCTIAPTDVRSKVTVRVHAYLEFSDVNVLCNVCSAAGAKCGSVGDCCEELVCDGPKRSSRTCKSPVLPGGRCTRTSQCTSGYCCRNKKCVPK